MAGGVWQEAAEVSPEGEYSLGLQLAVDPEGDAVAVWIKHTATGRLIESALRPAAGATWQEPVTLSDEKNTLALGSTPTPQVGFDAQGDVVAVWHRYNGSESLLETAARPATTGVWQEPVELSSEGEYTGADVRLAVDPQGNAVAVWERFVEGSGWAVVGAVGSAQTDAWQAPVELSTAANYVTPASVALDASGNALAVWDRGQSTDETVEASGYQATPPTMAALAIPATGTVAQPLVLSVSPLDEWSVLGPTSWALGDGTTASGNHVTHAYAAPGRYQVTVTGTDLLGNTTDASGAVTIAPGPPAITVPRVTNRRFRVARWATAISARNAPLGTSFRFTLSAAAKLTITITRSAPGLRHGRSCLPPTAKLRRRHAKHCTRTVTVARLTRSNEPSGADAVAFSGRIGHRPLSPLTYRATLIANNASGSSKPATLSFTVLR